MGYLDAKYLRGKSRTLTRIGQILDKPSVWGASEDGPYYASFFKPSSGFTLANELTSYKGLIYASTDHGDGGIAVAGYTDNIEDSWEWYNSGNFIYNDTIAGSQTETPGLIEHNGTLCMYYHQIGVGNNQTTCLATSTDGLSFTRQGPTTVDYDRSLWSGDAHTGYGQPFLNPGFDNPYTYNMFTLHGGQGGGYQALWGSNDPTDKDSWVRIKIMDLTGGRLISQLGLSSSSFMRWLESGAGMMRQVGPNFYNIFPIGSGSAGAGGMSTSFYEVPVDRTGAMVAGPAVLAMANGAEGTFDEDELACIQGPISENGKQYAIYTAAEDTENSIGIAEIIEGNDHTFPKLFPQKIARRKYEVDFSVDEALPSWLETNLQGSGSISYNSTTGAQLSVGDTDEAWIFSKDPIDFTTYDYISAFIEEFHTTSAQALRTIYWGITDTKGALSTWQNALIWNNVNTSGNASGLQYSDQIIGQDLGTDALDFTDTDATVVVNLVGHGIADGAEVNFIGIATSNGIDAANMNGKRTVTLIDADSFSFEADSAATSTGSGGGSSMEIGVHTRAGSYSSVFGIGITTSYEATSKKSRGITVYKEDAAYYLSEGQTETSTLDGAPYAGFDFDDSFYFVVGIQGYGTALEDIKGISLEYGDVETGS